MEVSLSRRCNKANLSSTTRRRARLCSRLRWSRRPQSSSNSSLLFKQHSPLFSSFNLLTYKLKYSLVRQYRECMILPTTAASTKKARSAETSCRGGHRTGTVLRLFCWNKIRRRTQHNGCFSTCFLSPVRPRIESLFSKIDEFVKMTYVDDIELKRQYAVLFDATLHSGLLWMEDPKENCYWNQKIDAGTVYGLDSFCQVEQFSEQSLFVKLLCYWLALWHQCSDVCVYCSFLGKTRTKRAHSKTQLASNTTLRIVYLKWLYLLYICSDLHDSCVMKYLEFIDLCQNLKSVFVSSWCLFQSHYRKVLLMMCYFFIPTLVSKFVHSNSWNQTRRELRKIAVYQVKKEQLEPPVG